MTVPPQFSEQLEAFCLVARRIAKIDDADSLLVMLEAPLDWQQLRKATDGLNVLVAADRPAFLQGAAEAGFGTVQLSSIDAPVHEQLTRALLESVDRRPARSDRVRGRTLQRI
jgi:diadenylate cyclase